MSRFRQNQGGKVVVILQTSVSHRGQCLDGSRSGLDSQVPRAPAAVSSPLTPSWFFFLCDHSNATQCLEEAILLDRRAAEGQRETMSHTWELAIGQRNQLGTGSHTTLFISQVSGCPGVSLLLCLLNVPVVRLFISFTSFTALFLRSSAAIATSDLFNTGKHGATPTSFFGTSEHNTSSILHHPHPPASLCGSCCASSETAASLVSQPGKPRTISSPSVCL